jgi:hypothetical protein
MFGPLLVCLAMAAAAQPADYAAILSWGSRPWEKVRPEPLVVEDEGRAFFFALETADLGNTPPRLPLTRREVTFARTVERLLHEGGAPPWPVFVFSAATSQPPSIDAVSLATTRRVFLREGGGAMQPAAAIVLNRAYWGTQDSSPEFADDRYTAVVARHELYHARRAWLRARETAACADAIEAKLLAAGTPQDRFRVEALVRRGMMAIEEVHAVDCSIGAAAIPSHRRRSFLEYREGQRRLYGKAVHALAALFAAGGGKEMERWLSGLLK